MIESVDDLIASVDAGPEPPGGLSPELCSMWLVKKGRWEDAHNIAQEIDTATGSWIHAHLHVIEGDLWNAGYWYRKANKPESPPEKIEEEWGKIVAELLQDG